MSTTHVTTSTTADSARTSAGRIRGRTIRRFVIAWSITPLAAGLVAFLIMLAIRPGNTPKD